MKSNHHYKEAAAFLTTLSQGNPNEVFHFQTFDDLKNSRRASLTRVLMGSLEEHFETLVELNNKGAGVFVCVNQLETTIKRDAKHVRKVRAVFADKDDGSFNQLPIEPSLIVQTRNGQHAYWLTSDVVTDVFGNIQKAIIDTLRTDPCIHDLARVMRLPGFYHKKDPNNPFLVSLVKANSNLFSVRELDNAFPRRQPNMNAASAGGNHAEVLKHIEKSVGAVQGEGGDCKTFVMACDLVRGFNLSQEEALVYLLKFNEKCSPPWTEFDLLAKLNSARKSGSGAFGYLLKNLTTEQWILRFIEQNQVKTTYNQKIYFKEQVVSPEALIRRAEIQWDSERRPSKTSVIKSIFEEWAHSSRQAILGRVRTRFRHNAKLIFPAGKDPLSQFTQALVGSDSEKFEQHRAVIAHFIWQVKRKIYGYEVNDHICPVLVGKQGSGKTKAIDNLIRPLKFLSIEGNLGMFVREAEKFVFGTYYIVRLDEFAKGTKSDVDSMKAIITASDINYRTFYTQKMAVMPNLATFIAASNRSVADVFNDQTGNRRFYEIPCLDRVDWSLIGGLTEDEGIDYCSLWTSINEEAESPATPFMDEIKKYQEAFRARSFVEEWLVSDDLIPQSTDSLSLIPLKELHRDFIEWLKKQNCNFSYTDQRLGRELSKYLAHKKRNTGSHYEVKSKDQRTRVSAEEEIEKFMSDALSAPIVLHRK